MKLKAGQTKPLIQASGLCKSFDTQAGKGRFTVLEILDAYRTVADAELMEHEALSSFHTAVATIEALSSSMLASAATGMTSSRS